MLMFKKNNNNPAIVSESWHLRQQEKQKSVKQAFYIYFKGINYLKKKNRGGLHFNFHLHRGGFLFRFFFFFLSFM